MAHMVFSRAHDRSQDRSEHVSVAVMAVIDAGNYAARRGWVPATSGNFSVRIDANEIAITRSGIDKGSLTPRDILIQPVDRPLLAGSSAEAALHIRRYADDPNVNAIFHIHGPFSSVIGRAHCDDEDVQIEGWELQKALAGVTTHETTVEIPVFANDQDIAALSDRIAARLARPASPDRIRAPGYLLAGHGLYAWGNSSIDAARHVEALEALFQQVITLRSYRI